MRPKPLAEIRVLDLTRLLPGPVCTLHLADMGADVIKIEDPIQGDYARSSDEPKGLDKDSAFFRAVNRNKRGLRLDLKADKGRQIFLQLAGAADVIVESFRPGVVDRLGIGFDRVRELNPRIVYCGISGYGQDGPYRDRAGHDINYCALTGVVDQIGPKSGAPVIPNFQIADLAGGSLSAVMGILAALLDARRSGNGRYVDVSMADCTLAHSVAALARVVERGAVRGRGDDRLSGALPCYNIYETSDGRHMALGALEEKFWRAFCAAVERPDLADRYAVTGAEADAVKTEAAAVFRSNTQAYWTQKLAPADCCATPVLTLEEAMGNELFQAREMFVGDQAGASDMPNQFALPIRFSEFRFELERSAPRPGEHSAEILAELGYGAEEIRQLQDNGVL